MNEAEMQAEIDRRVQEELAKERKAAETPQAQRELQARQNAGLSALVASANAEPASGYGSGRDFSRGRDLARRPGVQSAALGLAEEVRDELAGTQWELDDGV